MICQRQILDTSGPPEKPDSEKGFDSMLSVYKDLKDAHFSMFHRLSGRIWLCPDSGMLPLEVARAGGIAVNCGNLDGVFVSIHGLGIYPCISCVELTGSCSLFAFVCLRCFFPHVQRLHRIFQDLSPQPPLSLQAHCDSTSRPH